MNHSRSDAWALLTEYTQSESLRKHALAVEAAMRYFAEEAGEDIELWGCTGLLHDFDYERWPAAPDHPTQGMAILKEQGWPETMIEAIAGHALYLGVPRHTLMAKTLFAVDELCGLIMAVTYVRPSRSLSDVEPSSVIKKMKDKTFARSVSRDDIQMGADELGQPVASVVANCITAMQRVSDSLGL